MYRQFGLDHPLIVQLLEQLPNSERCSNYHFNYHPPHKILPWRKIVSNRHYTNTVYWVSTYYIVVSYIISAYVILKHVIQLLFPCVVPVIVCIYTDSEPLKVMALCPLSLSLSSSCLACYVQQNRLSKNRRIQWVSRSPTYSFPHIF